VEGWRTAICALFVVAAGCASAGPPAPASTASAPASGGPKALRIAFQGFEEPKDGIIGYGTAGGFDPLEHFMLFHASLAVYDPQGLLMPRLAEKVPSLQDGDWRLLPDGQMEVTWRLRPDARWHDGAPLVADDYALGFQVISDPEIPTSRPAWARLISDLHSPDPHTVVARWRETSFLAGGTGPGDLTSLPSHILTDLYQAGDRRAFINSPYWTTEFVGLGPYQLGRWQRGSFIEGIAFDGYVLGRPKIDRILLMYVGDVNAIVAGVLAGDLDMVPMGARFDAGQLVAVQNGWGPERGTTLLVPFGVRTIWLQFRDINAAWARDVRVRRAFVHATDRQGMSEALQYGLTLPADTFLPVEDPVYRALERRGFSRYPLDLARARHLLAEAGWTAGPDGALYDGSARALSLEIGATAQGGNVQEIETVTSQWQAIGIQANPLPLPPQSANLDERKNTVQGGFLWPWSPGIDSPQNVATAQIPSERTSWKGRNYGGYSHAVYDELYGRFTTTLDLAERQLVLADIMAFLANEVPVIPIYYYGNGVIARKGLDGPGMITPLQTASTWNIHTWDLR
jgi:peptide/nickel transport system substrate-binding protein